ncbi:hypothetical protein [Phytohabitans rumicis]|uniref:Uncharacterized protein n=1 Tax=Phytohabitans rumicis TaxID=1076125 RepID=A0A6V8LC54_9ACTN|nr:hypothetical protein [Phytohabitans rumicis]GFJ92169.1 hypothetical protein Prum_058110 [Phytohabitans rumicis]
MLRARLGIGVAVLAVLLGLSWSAPAEFAAPVSTMAAAESRVSAEVDAAIVVDTPAVPVPVDVVPSRATVPLPAAPAAARSAERSATAGRAPPLSR